jgi:hypothetical protein
MKTILPVVALALLASPAFAGDTRTKSDAAHDELKGEAPAEPSAEPSDFAPVTHSSSDKGAASAVSGSAEKYTRKTLIYFGARPISYSWADIVWEGTTFWGKRALAEMVGKAVGRSTRLKRFDFVDLPWGVRPTRSVLRGFSEFMNKAKMDKAAAEAEFLDRYKSFDIKSEDLARVMNSAYFYETELTRSRISRHYRCKKWKTKKVGKRTVRVRHKRGPKKGQPICLKGKWVYRCALGATVHFDHLKHTNPYRQSFAKVRASASKEADHPHRACRSAASSIGGTVNLRMRRLEPFRLKAPVLEKKASMIGFELGTREGLRVDQGMYVVEYDAQNKRKKVGYSRVRSVANNDLKDGKIVHVRSQAQLLTGRGDVGNQTLEDPSRMISMGFYVGSVRGLDLGVDLGYYLNSPAFSETWMMMGAAGDANENAYGYFGIKKLKYFGSIGLGIEADLAGDSEERVGFQVMAVAEKMFGGWGALTARGGMTVLSSEFDSLSIPVGAAGILIHF